MQRHSKHNCHHNAGNNDNGGGSGINGNGGTGINGNDGSGGLVWFDGISNIIGH